MEEIIIVEEWRNISGYLNYQASNIGRVRHIERGIIIPYIANIGYLQLNITKNCGKRTVCSVHRLVALAFIPNPMNKPSVDHINCKAKLNNTVENLRWATRKDQQGNTSAQLNRSSKYKGVSWHKINSKWLSRIYIDTHPTHIGMFQSEEDAALAYNEQAIEHFGEFANLNVVEHAQTQM